MNSKRAFHFGIIGSLTGILFVFMSMTPFGKIMDLKLTSPYMSIIAIAFSLLALLGCWFMKRNKEITAGFLMLIAAVGGIISMSLYYILPGLLLTCSGLMSIYNKDEQPIEEMKKQ